MSVIQKDVVDFVSTNEKGEVVLTISDHLDWIDKDSHLWILQEKVNAYLEFIEGGQIFEKYPDSRGRKLAISIKAMCEPSSDALVFLGELKKVIEGAGYIFLFEHTPLK